MDARVARFWLLVFILAGAGLIWASQHNEDDGKNYYEHMAERESSRCVNSGGVDTGWRGSSGITLEKFCSLYGMTKALAKQCHDQPATC